MRTIERLEFGRVVQVQVPEKVVEVVPYVKGNNRAVQPLVGLRALAARLDPDQAAAAARLALEVIGMTANDDVQSALVVDLDALLAKLDPAALPGRAGAIAGALAGASGAPTPLAGVAALVAVARPLPGRLSEQQLVDLLKMPSCRREARAVLVRQLGNQCGQRFDSLWDFVAWAQKNRPDLDLASPSAPRILQVPLPWEERFPLGAPVAEPMPEELPKKLPAGEKIAPPKEKDRV
jgi:hypothetical protein